MAGFDRIDRPGEWRPVCTHFEAKSRLAEMACARTGPMSAPPSVAPSLEGGPCAKARRLPGHRGGRDDALLDSLREQGPHARSGPPSATARSSSTRSSPRRSCPSGWSDEQDGGRYRLERRDDDALFGHAVGPALVEALAAPADASCAGGPAATTAASWRSRSGRRRRATRSSACGRASSPRSSSRTACSSAARSSTRPTARGARVSSSSPSSAARPRAPASARRWAPARAPRPASTSR